MAKDFKSDNPAMAFITTRPAPSVSVEPESVKSVTTEIPAKGYKINDKYIETRSRRFGVLLQLSVFNRLKEIADSKHISINEAINEAIKQYIAGDCDVLSFGDR